MKLCPGCGVEKAPEGFYANREHRDGLATRCKACDGKRRAKWDADHQQRAKAYRARYHQEHKTEAAERMRLWKQRNPGKMNAYGRKSKKKLRKRRSAENNRYLNQHPEKRAQFKRNRRGREKGALGSHTAAEADALVASYLGLCVYCGGPAAELDHVVSLAGGGSNAIENLVPACRRCNRSKKDKPLLYWLATRDRAAA